MTIGGNCSIKQELRRGKGGYPGTDSTASNRIDGCSDVQETAFVLSMFSAIRRRVDGIRLRGGRAAFALTERGQRFALGLCGGNRVRTALRRIYRRHARGRRHRERAGGVCPPEVNTADEVRWAFMRWVRGDQGNRTALPSAPGAVRKQCLTAFRLADAPVAVLRSRGNVRALGGLIDHQRVSCVRRSPC